MADKTIASELDRVLTAIKNLIPTKVSSLTNDSGFITSSGSCSYATTSNYANSAGSAPASDVYAWAKASTKPSYSASEISGLGSAATYGVTSSVASGSSALVTSGGVYSENFSHIVSGTYASSTAYSITVGFSPKYIISLSYHSDQQYTYYYYYSNGFSCYGFGSTMTPGGISVSGTTITFPGSSSFTTYYSIFG